MLGVKPAFRNQINLNSPQAKEVLDVLVKAGVKSIRRKFPHHSPPEREVDYLGRKLADLSLLYEIDVDENISLKPILWKLISLQAVEFAEPIFICKVLYNPNDYYANPSKMYYLDEVRAWQAWDIEQGDTNVAVGIIDTGTAFDHPELAGKFYINPNDPVDGIDNDGNGLIDDWRGWDFAGNGATPDNDPTYVGTGAGADHGVLVSGPVAALTDNTSGIAAVGFKTKIFPVKAAMDNSLSIWKGYDGIVYCADMGIPIVNLSWGGPGFSSYGKTITDYAAVNKGVLLVAAAGNTPQDIKFYPASFPGVLSVAGTTINKLVWANGSSGTSYNDLVDICAPAVNVRTIAKHSGYYGGATGTSMASPIVCAVAALVKSKYPNYTNDQLKARLKATALNLYPYNPDPMYQGKLGAGLVNAEAALTGAVPGMTLANAIITDYNGGFVTYPDSFEVETSWINVLDSTQNLTISTAVSDTHLLKITANGQQYLGMVPTYGMSYPTPMKFRVNRDVNEPTEVIITFTLEDTSLNYTYTEPISVWIYPFHLDLNFNQLHTTINGAGRFGMNMNTDGVGLGLNHQNKGNRAVIGGLMLGGNNYQVSDVAYDLAGAVQHDFQMTSMPVEITPLPFNGKLFVTRYNDYASGPNSLYVSVEQKSYVLTDPDSENELIMEYTISNDGPDPITGFYTGMFSHLNWGSNNATATWDPIYKMAVTQATLGPNNDFHGLVLLSMTTPNAGVGNIGSTLFTDTLKYNMMKSPGWSNILTHLNPHLTVATGGQDLMPGAKRTVAFALVAGNTLTELQDNAKQAKMDYYCMILGMNTISMGSVSYDKCPGDTIPVSVSADNTNINWSNGMSGNNINVVQPGTYTMTGNNLYGCYATGQVVVNDFPAPVMTLPDSATGCGSVTLYGGPVAGQNYLWDDGTGDPFATVGQSGLFGVQVVNSYGCQASGSTVVTISNYTASISINDTAPLVGDLVQVAEANGAGTQWNWNFGDGSAWTSGQQAGHTYANPGTYLIELAATDGICFDTVHTSVQVSQILASMDQAVGNSGGMVVYPNPGAGDFSVQLPHNGPSVWQVFDTRGRALQAGRFDSLNSGQLSLNLPNGAYLLQVAQGDFTWSQRLVIAK